MWVQKLKANSKPDIKIFLIGNKADLEDKREVSTEEAEKLKDDYKFDLFMEASAKTGFNAKEIFVKAAKIILKEFNEYKKYNIDKQIKISDFNYQNEVRRQKNCGC